MEKCVLRAGGLMISSASIFPVKIEMRLSSLKDIEGDMFKENSGEALK